MRSANSRASKKLLDNIADIDEILAQAHEQGEEKADQLVIDQSLDLEPIPEEEEKLPVNGKKKSKMKIPLNARGKRVIEIQELDPNIIPPTLESFTDPTHTGSKIAFIGKPGCFAKGTMIRMFDGTLKPVEQIKVGDRVMGDDSTVRNVLELCSGFETMYRVTPLKGESFVVNERHKLALKSSGTCRHRKGEILDIEVRDFLSYPAKNRYKWYRTGVEYPEQPVLIDPYMLGCWLGDGTSACTAITSVDPEIIKYFQEYCEKTNNLQFNRLAAKYRYSITRRPGCQNSFGNALRHYNLINNKHIPLVYKVNGRQQRLALLAGLLDTDGSLSKSQTDYEITFKSQTLLDDTIELARSLGFAAYKKVKISKCKNSPDPNHSDTYYRAHISGEGVETIPCLLPRKRAKPRKQIKNALVTGFSLEKLPPDFYYGFTLDGNHKFLLSDFSVTNNTGKSTMIKSILWEKSEIFPCAQVFSGTEDSNHAYASFIPSTFVFNGFSQSVYINFIKRQKMAKAYLENPWAVEIWDDITEDERIFNLPVVKGTYKNGRHWKMLHILSLQYALDIKPVIRTNIDGTFILRETVKRNRKVLYENYSSVFDDFGDFCDVMDQVTNDYTALYIHNRTQSNNFADCVFWYKARPDIPKDFKFGCNEIWMFHNQRYNQAYVDPIEV